MNNPGSILVRAVLVVAMLAMAAEGTGQGRKPLASGFDRLSAKERTRIAEKETADAAQDTAYQRLMEKGDDEFRAQRYEEALEAYTAARELRPYNVYPKVKIEDLQALIRKRDMAKPGDAPAQPAHSPAQGSVPGQSPPAAPAAPGAAPGPVPSIAPPAGRRAQPEPSREEPTLAAPAPKAGEQPPLMEEHRVYMEAGAVVTERLAVDEGRQVVYKKVAHPWGQTFYFKDGRPIPEREWQARFTAAER